VSNELQGQRIAFLVADSGVEQIELATPWHAIEEAGGQPVLIAPEKDTVQADNHDLEFADTFSPSHAVADVDPADFAGLVLPGGVANPDKLRLVAEAVSFVKSFAEAGKPIAAICHGPWTLVRSRHRQRQDPHQLAQPPNRHPQRGRPMARRGGRDLSAGRFHPRHQPKA
jgi:protease I